MKWSDLSLKHEIPLASGGPCPFSGRLYFYHQINAEAFNVNIF